MGSVGFQYDMPNPSYRLTHYNSIINDTRLDLVGCIDPIAPIALGDDVLVFPDLDSCEKKADIYVVAVPTSSHVSTVESIIGKVECKLIFLEKPGGANLAQTEYIAELSRKYNVPILINLFRDVVANDVALLLKTLGEVKKVGIEYTGTLDNIGIHFLSFIEKIVGSEICSFQFNPGENFKSYSFTIGDVPVFVVENSIEMPLNNEIVFLCQNGKLVYLNDNNTLNIYKTAHNPIFPGETNYQLFSTESLHLETSLARVYDSVIEFLSTGECDLRTIEELYELKRKTSYE